MRKIKFRIWDNKYHRYRKRDQWALTVDGKPLRYFLGESGGFDFVDDSNLLLEQYTGNKDKNGKEIYEGDIILTEGHFIGMYFNQIRSEQERKKSSFYSWKAKVIWDDGYASFLLEYINQDYNGRGNLIGTAPWAEVIGNIHENPELLDITPKKD